MHYSCEGRMEVPGVSLDVHAQYNRYLMYLVSLCREMCLMAYHLHKTFNSMQLTF